VWGGHSCPPKAAAGKAEGQFEQIEPKSTAADKSVRPTPDVLTKINKGAAVVRCSQPFAPPPRLQAKLVLVAQGIQSTTKVVTCDYRAGRLLTHDCIFDRAEAVDTAAALGERRCGDEICAENR
jgi:hypothetical protein